MRSTLAYPMLLCFAISFFLLGCQEGTSSKAGDITTKQSKAAKHFTKGKDYRVLKRARISDKDGFDEPVEVFSLLIPDDWEYNGEVTWIMPGENCAGNRLSFYTASADGRYSYELLPTYAWSITDNEQVNYYQRAAANRYCGVGQPMDAENYLRSVLIHELGSPEIVTLTHKEIPAATYQKLQQNDQQMLRYGIRSKTTPTKVLAEVRWSDGSEGIISCQVNMGHSINVHPYLGIENHNYFSEAFRVLFRYPQGQKTEAEKIAATIETSFRMNPSWQQTVDNFWSQAMDRSHMAHLNKLQMMENYRQASVQQHRQRMAAMDSDMRAWEQRSAAQDKAHDNFIKTIRGVETYTDQTGTYEVSSSYDQVWSRNDGSSFIVSDDPNFDPSSVFVDQQWQQMQRQE